MDVERGELSSGFYLKKLTFNRLAEPRKNMLKYSSYSVVSYLQIFGDYN